MSNDTPRRSSGTNKVLLGCAAVTIVSLLLLCAGGVMLGRKGWQAVSGVLEKVNAFVAEFEEQGYKRVTGQVIDVTTPVDEPTVYKAQVVELKADSNADLAFAVQIATIHGTVNGDIDFMGQVLEIGPKAHVTGDIRVRWGQVVNVIGKVDGEIKGDVQVTGPMPAQTPPVVTPGEAPQAPEALSDEAPAELQVPAEAPQPAGDTAQ